MNTNLLIHNIPRNKNDDNTRKAIEMLIKACHYVNQRDIMPRSSNGKFLPKSYNSIQSKYKGIFKNDNRWVVYIGKEKYRFNNEKEAYIFFVNHCKKNNIDIKSKIREGWNNN